MNREIHFRIWDSFYRMMIYSKDKDFVSLSEFIQVFEERNKEGNECTLMQFTGLKDKNGKEIYEWDILKTPCGFLNEEFNYTYVEYKSEISSYIKRTRDTRSFVRLEIRISEVEVIGNIFETPELLNP